MLSIKTKNEEMVEKTLQDILDKNVTVETFQETVAMSLETAEYDKVNAMLLEYYNDRNKGDLQSDLRRELKLMVNKKVLSKLNNAQDLEKTKEEKVKEIGNEENVDKDTLEKASKNLNEKEKQNDKQEQNKEFDLRAELMKQVYIEEFKRYSNLLYRLKEKEASYRELTIGDEEGTKLVLYEKYLMNLEANYKGYANLNKLEEKTLNDNDEIKTLKDKLATDVGKKEEYIDNKVNKRLNNVKDLYEKRQEIAKKMCEIADNKSLQQDKVEFQKQMDYYQEEYRKLTYEMRVQDPTLDDYQEMIKIERENKEFAIRELGYNSEVGFSTGYSDTQKEIDNKTITKSIEAKAVNMEQQDDVVVGKTVGKSIHDIEFLLRQDIDYDKAESLLKSVETQLKINENQNDEAKGKQQKISNEKLDENIDKNTKDKSDSQNIDDVNSQCKNAIVDNPNKYVLQERLRRVKAKYNEMYHDVKEEVKENSKFEKSL